MTLKATYEINQLKTGNDPVNTTEVVIASGQSLAEHVPLGLVTASGKYIESKSTANDGSQTPVYFTAYAVDASTGDQKAQVVKSGTFDPGALAWDASFTDEQKLAAFAGTPISLQTTDKV